MPIIATKGTKICIGGVLGGGQSDMHSADFSSQSWTEIKPVESLGTLGDTSEEITFGVMGEGRMQKLKGLRNAGSMELVIGQDYSDAGQIALLAAERSERAYAFRLVFNDAPEVATKTVTMTIAAPGVVTWTGHGLVVGDAVSFASTGALPSGIVAGTTYYVKTVSDANSFTLATTPGGAAITTTGSQSGTHTGSTVPTGSQRLFAALVMSASETLAEANNVVRLNATLSIDSNVVRVPATA